MLNLTLKKKINKIIKLWICFFFFVQENTRIWSIIFEDVHNMWNVFEERIKIIKLSTKQANPIGVKSLKICIFLFFFLNWSIDSRHRKSFWCQCWVTTAATTAIKWLQLACANGRSGLPFSLFDIHFCFWICISVQCTCWI